MSLSVPLFRIIELISWQTSAYSSLFGEVPHTDTVRPLINGGKDQLEPHYRGEIIQREGIEKLLVETNTPHILYNGLYVHIHFF